MQASTTQVSVIGNVADLIFVDIHNKSHQYESFDYVIYNDDKKVVRKGNFRAPYVQIRTNHLKEGTYQFQLILNGQVWETTEFRKKPEVFAFA